MTRPPAALFVAGLVVWCAGCPRKAADPAAALARVEYARRTFRSSLAGCTDAASGAPMACVRLEIDYVDLTRAPGGLVDAVGAFVASTVLRPAADAEPVSSVEDLRDELYERYRAQQRETPGYKNQWLVQRSIKVVCSTERVLALTGGRGVHSVLECVGTEQSMNDAVAIARPGGAIGRVGVPHYEGVAALPTFTRTSWLAAVPLRCGRTSTSSSPTCSRAESSPGGYSTASSG